MPIDDIAEGFFRLVFRFLGRFLLELLFEIVCYCIGWGFLKIVSFGQYPKGAFEDDSSDTICSIVGLVVIIAAAIAFAVAVNQP